MEEWLDILFATLDNPARRPILGSLAMGTSCVRRETAPVRRPSPGLSAGPDTVELPANGSTRLEDQLKRAVR